MTRTGLFAMAALGVVLRVFGAVAEKPSPNQDAIDVGGQVTLAWTVPGTELLVNGGFEQGSNGWTFISEGPIRLSRFDPQEGTNVLSTLGGVLSRTITLPAIHSPIIWSYAKN